jgi:preprotein translocase subunit SecG
MHVLLTVLYVAVAVLLIGVVLIQQPKSNAGLFSGAGQSLLGTGAKTFMTKFTTVLASVFMLLCLALAIMPRGQGSSQSAVAELLTKQQQAEAQAAAQAASRTSNTGTEAAPSDAAPSGAGTDAR